MERDAFYHEGCATFEKSKEKEAKRNWKAGRGTLAGDLARLPDLQERF